MTDDVLKVRSNIYLGEWDEHLDDLLDTIQKRKEQIASNLFKKLIPGSLVRFNDHVRPKYLIGVPATVVERKQKKVVIKIGQDVGRYTKAAPISTDVQLLDLIEPPPLDD